MINSTKLSLLFIACTLILSGCLKRNDYPETPAITFKTFETRGDSGIVTITFTDGDGDLGYPKSDTVNRDFFLKYFEKRNGKYVERNLAIPFYYKIPVLTEKDQNKPLEGDITVYLTPTYYDPFSQYDSIKYEIYIKDRAMHESNHLEYELVAPN